MTTTEIALRDGSGLVAVTDEFAAEFPAIAPNEALAEMLAEAMDGIELSPQDLPRIKVPSGGGTLWTVVKDGKETAVDEVSGALVFLKKQRLFWSNPDPSGSAPDCVSLDGKRPEPGGMFAPDGPSGDQNPFGTCEKCPMSKAMTDLKGGRGSACKEQRLLFLVQPGTMLPVVVTAPPSSIKSIEKYIVSLVMQGTPWWQVRAKLTLERATNKANQTFARIVATPDGKFTNEEAVAVKAYGTYIKDLVESASVSEFIDASQAVDEENEGLKVGAAG